MIPLVLRFFVFFSGFVLFFPTDGASTVSDELLSKAEEYYKNSEFEKARIIYEDLAKEKDFPFREQVLFKFGKTCHNLKLHDRSYEIHSTLLGEYPGTIYYQESLNLMLDILAQRKEYEKALSLIDAAPPEIRKTAEMKERYLAFLEYRGFFSKALEYLEHNFTPSSWTWNKKNQYLKSMGDYDRIIRVIQSNMNGENRLESYRVLADACESKGDYPSSLVWLEKLHGETGKIEHLLNGLRMLIAHGLSEEATSLTGKIFGLMGKNRNTYLMMAAFYRDNGFYPDLIRHYEEAKKEGFDFTKEKILAYEVLGQYEQAVREYAGLLNENEYVYVLERLSNLSLLEDEKHLIRELLPQMEEKYPKKRKLLLKLEVQLFTRLQDREGLARVLGRYLKTDGIDIPFLENIMNLMYRQMNYGEIARMYRLFSSGHRELISPLMKIRYAQALYFKKAHSESLEVLKGLNQDLLREEVDYYRVLNLIRLKKEQEAVTLLSTYRSRFAFFSELFKIRMRRGECSLARSELKQVSSSFQKHEALYLDILGLLCASQVSLLVKDLEKYMELYSQTVYANDLGLVLFILKRDLSDEEKKLLMGFLSEYYADNYETARGYAMESLKREDLWPLIDYYRSRIYALEGNYKASLDLCQKLVLEKSYIRPYILELAGNIYLFQLKDKASGLKYFRTILAEYPNYLNVNSIRKTILSQE